LQLLPLEGLPFFIKFSDVADNDLPLLLGHSFARDMSQTITNGSQRVEFVGICLQLRHNAIEKNNYHLFVLRILIDWSLRDIVDLDQSIALFDQFQCSLEDGVG